MIRPELICDCGERLVPTGKRSYFLLDDGAPDFGHYWAFRKCKNRHEGITEEWCPVLDPDHDQALVGEWTLRHARSHTPMEDTLGG